jgi:hypothetical protein
MNRYNSASEGENEDKKDAAEQPKSTHQGNRDNEKPKAWNPGKDTGNDENKDGVRPE